jgi:fumarate hydratase subunit beta
VYQERNYMERKITTPLTKDVCASLRAGDFVYISGVLYSARDAAHKRMANAIARGEELPLELFQNVLYYMGPSPAQPGKVIGSAGPTTSGRMDRYTPELLDLGLAAMIGKGRRSQVVLDALHRNGAVYLAAIGGAGALLSHAIIESEIIAYPDLGTEAIRRLVVRDFPAIVVYDTLGNDLYARRQF